MKHALWFSLLCIATISVCSAKQNNLNEKSDQFELSETEKYILVEIISENLGLNTRNVDEILSKKDEHQKAIHKWIKKANKTLGKDNHEQLDDIKTKATCYLTYKGIIHDYTDIEDLRNLIKKTEEAEKKLIENGIQPMSFDEEDYVEVIDNMPPPPSYNQRTQYSADGIYYSIDGNEAVVESTDYGIKELHIPAAVTINDITYTTVVKKYLDNVSGITVDEDHDFYKSVDGVLFNKDMSIILYYPSQKKDALYKLPETVKAIKSGSFFNNGHIEEIVLPEGLKAIHHGAFAECPKLKRINLPSTIDCIGDFIFNGDNGITINSAITNPPTIQISNFEESVEALIVPKGSGDIYKSRIGWYEIKDIREK